jgi:hypothetical protein
MSDKTIVDIPQNKEPEQKPAAPPVQPAAKQPPVTPKPAQQKGKGMPLQEKVLVSGAVLSSAGLAGIAIYGLGENGEPGAPIDQQLIKDDAPLSTAVTDGMGFKDAFDAARAEVGPGGYFEWRGNIYNTYTEAEWTSMTPEQKEQYVASLGDAVPEHTPETPAPVRRTDAPVVEAEVVAEPTSYSDEQYSNMRYVNQPDKGDFMEGLSVNRAKVVDINQDGVVDGIVLDMDADDAIEAVVYDTDGDQVYDAVLIDTDNDNALDAGAALYRDGNIGPLTPLENRIPTPDFDDFSTPDIKSVNPAPGSISDPGVETPPAIQTEYTDAGPGAKSLYDNVASTPETVMEDDYYYQEPDAGGEDFYDDGPNTDDNTAWT